MLSFVLQRIHVRRVKRVARRFALLPRLCANRQTFTNIIIKIVVNFCQSKTRRNDIDKNKDVINFNYGTKNLKTKF